MFETVVIATDGSASAKRAVVAALDIADRFDATVHALYVVDEHDIESSPEEVRDDLESALQSAGDEALSVVEREAGECPVVTATRAGQPATEIMDYAVEVDADLIAMGTRGRHGEHAFLLGSVAERIVRQASTPVLTVRQLDGQEATAER
ncbi:universal stress protein [Halovenus marina]|uniref:universal stress protein n=1 Tax=Halovenus marina TaxID=3396621 RepID=UPI003F55C442